MPAAAAAGAIPIATPATNRPPSREPSDRALGNSAAGSGDCCDDVFIVFTRSADFRPCGRERSGEPWVADFLARECARPAAPRKVRTLRRKDRRGKARQWDVPERHEEAAG